VSFLVLEFVEGADLSAIVKRDSPMESAEAAAICLQAASGLAYSHAQGVVHRDIKPQNILFSTKGVAKILDMGLARRIDEAADDHTALTQEGAIMGTIDYMPPERGIDPTLLTNGPTSICSAPRCIICWPPALSEGDGVGKSASIGDRGTPTARSDQARVAARVDCHRHPRGPWKTWSARCNHWPPRASPDDPSRPHPY
jgi:serine/threonine protein kinase